MDKPIEMLTTFKPFTVRELEYEVWDTSQAKQDRYLRQYGDLGLLNQSQMDVSNTSIGAGVGNGMAVVG